MAKKKSKRRTCDFSALVPNHRYFGRFLCPECKRHWQSSNAWLHYRQRCAKCRELVEPYELRSLEIVHLVMKPEDCEPHPQEMCERCIQLGHSCRDLADGEGDIPSSSGGDQSDFVMHSRDDDKKEDANQVKLGGFLSYLATARPLVLHGFMLGTLIYSGYKMLK